MYDIQQDTIKGITVYNLFFGGYIKGDEMKQWVEASRRVLASAPDEFVVNVDMRTLGSLPEDAQEEMRIGQRLYKEKGMRRSAVLVDKFVTKMQFERIAKDSGIYEWERYFSSEEPDWEISIKKWLTGENS